MKLLKIDVFKKSVYTVDLAEKHHYTDLKKLLGIDSPIDCVQRKIGGTNYDIWLDDEGLLKPNLVSGICSNVQEKLVGNLLISTCDKMGNTTGLTPDDIANIVKNVLTVDTYESLMGHKLPDEMTDGLPPILFYEA